MKVFDCDFISNIRPNSLQIADPSNFAEISWVPLVEERPLVKTIYLFCLNGDAIVASNGKIKKGRWDILAGNSIFIEMEDHSERNLLTYGFVDKTFLITSVNGSKDYAVFVCEQDYERGIDTIGLAFKHLKEKYIKNADNEISNDASFFRKKPLTYVIIDQDRVKGRRHLYKCTVMFSDSTCGVLYVHQKWKYVYFEGNKVCGIFRTRYYFANIDECIMIFYENLNNGRVPKHNKYLKRRVSTNLDKEPSVFL